MIFDSHAHYNDEAFDEDREALLSSFQENNIAKVVNVCSDRKSIGETMELIEQYDFFYGALGFHPSDTTDMQEADIERIQDICQKDSMHRIVAIGEIGLDYHWPEPSAMHQKKWFCRQMVLARELHLPVVIHSREACQDTLEILREFPEVTGIIHCYSYSKESAREYLELGYSIGIGGVVTFKNAKKLKEAVEYIPIEKIVLETDCPYMAPEPHRGTRNTSLNIPFVISQIAQLKGLSEKEVEEMTYENTCRIFGIS